MVIARCAKLLRNTDVGTALAMKITVEFSVSVNHSVHLHLPFLIVPNKRQKWGLRRQKVPCGPVSEICILGN